MLATTRGADRHAELVARLCGALARFQHDASVAGCPANGMPDARQRLAHVVRLTDDAAHRTLDLVERSGPLAERIGEGARTIAAAAAGGARGDVALATYLGATAADAETLRRNLSEVLLAQCYQDITGQIIRGVINLVTEIEAALAELAQGSALARADDGRAVNGQQDVDALLSDLGL
jgi:chemotaxis protein CheZ